MSDKFDILKNKVKGSLAPIGEFATALGPMVIAAPMLATGISAMAASQIVATAATWLQTAAMTALNFALGPIGLIILGIVAAVAAAILIFKNWDKIVETFKQTWDKVWGAIKSLFDTVMGAIESVFNSKFGWLLPGGALVKALFLLRDNWDTIWNGMKATVSLVVDGIKGYVNLLISALNLMIRGANMISIKVPKWVPGIGGKGFSLNIPEIPKLAEGGIVRSPTLAMLGEAGPEAAAWVGSR
jgi:phage-related minor tail protein